MSHSEPLNTKRLAVRPCLTLRMKIVADFNGARSDPHALVEQGISTIEFRFARIPPIQLSGVALALGLRYCLGREK